MTTPADLNRQEGLIKKSSKWSAEKWRRVLKRGDTSVMMLF